MTKAKFVDDGLSAAAAALRPFTRALLVTGPSRRFADQAVKAIMSAGVSIEVFDGARVHVPAAVVRDASRAFLNFRPGAVVSLGGGAATGVVKALRLEHSFFFVAIPTTYAGSEMTTIYGITEDKSKRTGRDPRAGADLVIYDPYFTRALPVDLTVKSLFNALAHPISALSTDSLDDEATQDAVKAIHTLMNAVARLVEAPEYLAARVSALHGTRAAAGVLERGKLGLHHRLAHLLGGRFSVEHGGLHAVLLPYSVAEIRSTDPNRYTQIEQAFGRTDVPGWLWNLLRRSGAPSSLQALGISESDLSSSLAGASGMLRALPAASTRGPSPPANISGRTGSQARGHDLAIDKRPIDAWLSKASVHHPGPIADCRPQGGPVCWSAQIAIGHPHGQRTVMVYTLTAVIKPEAYMAYARVRPGSSAVRMPRG